MSVAETFTPAQTQAFVARLLDICAQRARLAFECSNSEGEQAWQARGMQVIEGRVDYYFSVWLHRFANDGTAGLVHTNDEAVFLRFCRTLARTAPTTDPALSGLKKYHEE